MVDKHFNQSVVKDHREERKRGLLNSFICGLPLALSFYCGLMHAESFTQNTDLRQDAYLLSSLLVRVPLNRLPWKEKKIDSSVSMVAIENNHLVQLPFVEDRFSSRGWLILDSSSVRGKDTTPSFMFISFFLHNTGFHRLKDCGVCQEQLNGAEILAETEIKLGDELRYIYWIKNSPTLPRKKVQIEHHQAQHTLKTKLYTVRFNPRNYLDIAELYLGEGENRIDFDTIKIRVVGNILLGMSPLMLDNRNLKTQLLSAHEQSIRSVFELLTHVVVAGVSVMKVKVQAHIYENKIILLSEIDTPPFVDYTYWDVKLMVTLDGQKDSLMGAYVTPGGGKLHAGLVDGVLSAEELAFNGKVAATENQWIFLHHPEKAFQAMLRLHIDQSQGEIARLFYQDDPYLVNKPEKWRGQSPNFGFLITGLERAGTSWVGLEVGFSREALIREEDRYIQKLNSSMEFTSKAFAP